MSLSEATLQAQREVVRLHNEGRKLWDVYKHLWKEGVLEDAWKLVRKNQGAAGIDRETIEDLEPQIQRVIHELRGELRAKTFRPQPSRRVWIPKKNGKKRPLGIPTVKDRIVQGAIKLILEPLYERLFRDSSFGYRPGRRAQTEIKRLAQKIHFNRRYVLEVDIRDFFTGIRHGKMLAFLRKEIVDPRMLGLIQRFLTAGIMDRGRYEPMKRGTPQGGVISPLLSNIYLHYGLDEKFEERVTNREWAMLFRYADDFVICCQKMAYANRSRALVEVWLKEIGLEVSPEKTRIVDMSQISWQSHFDFLGFRIHLRMGKQPGETWVARQPSEGARKSLHEQLRQSLRPELRYEEVRKRLVEIWGGWTNYYRYGNSTKIFRREFGRLRRYTARYLRKRHRRGRNPMPWRRLGKINQAILLKGIGCPGVVN